MGAAIGVTLHHVVLFQARHFVNALKLAFLIIDPEHPTPASPARLPERGQPAAVHDVPAVRHAWNRALERLPTDPEGAITAARTMLEATLRHVLDESGVAYSDRADLPDLTKPAVDALALAPTKRANIAVQRLLGACQTVVQNVGALRNELGDAQVGGARQPRHAELAVNLAGAMAMFLLRTIRKAPDVDA